METGDEGIDGTCVGDDRAGNWGLMLGDDKAVVGDESAGVGLAESSGE